MEEETDNQKFQRHMETVSAEHTEWWRKFWLGSWRMVLIAFCTACFILIIFKLFGLLLGE